MVPVLDTGYRMHHLVTDSIGGAPSVEEHRVVEHDASLDDSRAVVQYPGHADEGSSCHRADDDRPDKGTRLQVLAGEWRHAVIGQPRSRLGQHVVELVDHPLDK